MDFCTVCEGKQVPIRRALMFLLWFLSLPTGVVGNGLTPSNVWSSMEFPIILSKKALNGNKSFYPTLISARHTNGHR